MIYGYDNEHCKHEVYGKTEIDDKLKEKSDETHNHDDIYIKTTEIKQIIKLTQAQYNGLATKDSSTLYVIVG